MKSESYYKSGLQSAGKEQGWWDVPGMVVAQSGGGDSLAMGLMLRRYWGGRQVWGHLDHVTKDDSREDADFVASLARTLGIKCHRHRIPVYELERRKESIEMAGRRVRYGYLASIAASEELPFVCLGHTSDDQAETVIMHIIRGSGLTGLSGIQGRRDMWVRPCIGFSRTELRDFLKLAGQERWVEDVTNAYPIYRRNRIRHHLIPWVEENLNSRFSRALLGLQSEAQDYRARDEAQSAQALQWLARHVYPASACWSRKAARALAPDSMRSCIRAQGRTLDLSVLDRERALELERLILGRDNFRFQWALRTEVCGSKRYVGWIDVSQETPESLFVPISATTVRWGDWDVRITPCSCKGGLRITSPGLEIRAVSGEESLAMRSVSHENVLEIRSMPETGIEHAVPWWARRVTPCFKYGKQVLYQEDEPSNPGCYDMIARVSYRLAVPKFP